MAEFTPKMKTSDTSSSSTWKRIVHLQASSALTLSTVVLMLVERTMAAKPNPPPLGSKPLWRETLDRVKEFAGYAGAVHKLVLIWRAISIGYIGRALLKWAGWL